MCRRKKQCFPRCIGVGDKRFLLNKKAANKLFTAYNQSPTVFALVYVYFFIIPRTRSCPLLYRMFKKYAPEERLCRFRVIRLFPGKRLPACCLTMAPLLSNSFTMTADAVSTVMLI